MNIYLIVCN